MSGGVAQDGWPHAAVADLMLQARKEFEATDVLVPGDKSPRYGMSTLATSRQAKFSGLFLGRPTCRYNTQ